MESFSHLPSEIWVMIMLYLGVKELVTCNCVCRKLKELTGAHCEQHFRLELQAAGYVEPKNIRTDIGILEKLSILRCNRLRWNTHSPSKIEELHLSGTYNGAGIAHGDYEPTFSDGVLAQWNMVEKNSMLPLRLDLVQLPSQNKGISQLKEWHIIEPIIPVDSYWLCPKYDLLVLLWVNHKGQSEFHLRTLSTNEPHPDVVHSGCLRLESRAIPFPVPSSLQVVGRFIFVHFSSISGHIFGWNWTTGELQLDKKTGFGASGNLAFLSDTILVVPRAVSNVASTDTPIAALDIYSLNPGDGAGLDMNIVATLDISPSGPAIPGSPLLKLECFVDPIRQPSSDSTPVTRGLPAVFEPIDVSRTLFIRFDFPASGDTYFLFVPLQSIQHIIDHLTARSSTEKPRQVAWEHWATRAYWLYSSPIPGMVSIETTSQHLTSGVNIILPRMIHKSEDENDWPKRYKLVLDILELGQKTSYPERVDYAPTPHIDDRRMKTIAPANVPYTKSVFAHAEIEYLAYQEYLITWVDEEHLLFLKRNELRNSCGIDVFTF